MCWGWGLGGLIVTCNATRPIMAQDREPSFRSVQHQHTLILAVYSNSAGAGLRIDKDVQEGSGSKVAPEAVRG